MPKCDFNKVASSFIEITLRDGCSPVNLLHFFKTSFPKNITGRLLLLQLQRCNSVNQIRINCKNRGMLFLSMINKTGAFKPIHKHMT